uniref:Uncharacterized protein n=1 Tax=Arundo donax TaxID=35708 RepID=A0A0A9AMA1_ARUDO
MFPELGIYNC